MQECLAKPTAAEVLILRANNQGSTAKTVKGAIAFLKKIKVEVIPGFAALRGGEKARLLPRHFRRIDFDRKFGSTHKTRCEVRADAIILQLPWDLSPGMLIDRGHLACIRMTEDLKATLHQRLLKGIAARLKKQFSDSWPYRKSASGWAGGNHHITVSVGLSPSAKGWSTREFSRNGKWSGSDSHAALTITERCVRLLGYELIHGGLLMLDAEAVGQREYRAVWVAQARGFELKLVEGWWIRGFHVIGGTLEKARKLAAKARRQRAIQLRAEQLEGAVGAGCHDLKKVMVLRKDSIQAGNCAAGTDAFIARYQDALAGRKCIPAAELLGLERSAFTLAAVRYALARYLEDTKSEVG